MYFVSNLQPKIHVIDSQYNDMFLTRREQEEQIRSFYRSKKKIYLCLDHGGDDTDRTWSIPKGDRIGEVRDLFINKEGMMMVKLKLDDNHPFYREINQSMHVKKEGWGVSMWIYHMEDTRTGEISKILGHVALTKDPLFGQFGTYFYGYGVLEQGVDKAIGEQFYQEGSGESFAAKELKAKIKGMLHWALRKERRNSNFFL